MTTPTSHLMLATENHDLGLVARDAALKVARFYSRDNGETVYIRHPISDRVLIKVLPPGSTR